MLEVELYKIVDAGHFWCKPSSRDKTEAENYYTLIGKINDYCCKTEKQASNQKSKIPKKGKICLVKRTSDRCWYRAKVLSIFQTINGPQTRVLLVDLGERTLVPGIWVQDIPEEFLKIPYQTMECVLSGLKPLTMVTSYFDLTTKKQPGDTWDVSATEWFKKQINGCNLQLDVKLIDDDGIHHVLLFVTGSDTMICLNDELVNDEYAVMSKSPFEASQDEKKSSSSKDRAQDSFSEELKDMRGKLNNSHSLNSDTSSHYEPLTNSGKQSKYQPLTWSEESEGSAQGSGNELGKQPISVKGWDSGRPISVQGYSSDDERNKVRFMSARLPNTGSSRVQPFECVSQQPKPILKNSSGYSSSEDSQRDIYSQRRVPKHVSGLSKGVVSSTAHYKNANFTNVHNYPTSTQHSQRDSFSQGTTYARGDLKASNSASAHDQNDNLTNQPKDVYSNSIAGSTQNFQLYNQDSQKNTQKDMPAYMGALSVRGNSASTFDQNDSLPRQSQNVIYNQATSGQQNEQIIPNVGFSRQNIQNEVETNVGQYSSPGYSTSLTDQQNMPNAGSNFARQNIQNELRANTGQYSIPGQSSFGQHSNLAYSSTSTSQQNMANVGSTFARQTTQNDATRSGFATSLTNQQNMSNAGSRQNIQNEMQTTSGQYSNSGYSTSSANQQITPNAGSAFVRQNIKNELPTNTGQYAIPGQAWVGQNSDYHASPTGQQNMPNAGLTFARKNQNELQTSSGQYPGPSHASFGQNSSPVYPTTNQQRQIMPGNNQKVSNYLHFEQSMNNNTSSRASTPPQQNFLDSSITRQPVTSNQNLPLNSPSNGPPSSPYQNFPLNVPGNPPPSVVRKPPQSTQIPTSQVQPPYIPSTASYFPNGNNQQPLQNIPPQTSRHAPITTSRSHRQPMSPEQSINVPYGQLRQENLVPTTSQNRNIPTNTVPFSSVPNSQAQSTTVPQSRVQQQSPYTPYNTFEYPNVPSNQGQSTTIPQQGTHQQNFQPKQTQYSPNDTFEYPNVPSYQVQSKGITALQQQNIPQKQAQNLATNTWGFPNEPNKQAQSTNVPFNQAQQQNLPSSESNYVPISTTEIEQQNLQFPPKQTRYNPVSTSEYPNVPNSQAQSTCVPQDQLELQNYPPRQPQYGPESLNVPTSQAQSTSVPQSHVQQQKFSPTPLQYTGTLSSTSKYPNVPISQQYHTSTIPQPSPSVPTGMAQSLDNLSNTNPSQRLPTGQTPSGIHMNQTQSHPTSNYPSSAPGIPRSTTRFLQDSPKTSEYIHDNQVRSSDYQSSSTQHDAVSLTPTSNIPRSPVQNPSIQRSPTKSPRIPSSPMPNAKLCHVTSDVIRHGVVMPPSLTEIDSKTFPEGVQRGLRDLCVIKPSSFQANIWPAILRGRDVFGIPESSSDNVMAYLAPIITLLAEPASYSALPLGNGALALILCEGWRKATTVYEQFRKVTKNVRNIRVQIVYGAGAEDECIPSLINGCEVLIATLPCLLRMLRKKCTRLDRLCHLVFDDADILAEEQTECVKELMREYYALLKSQPDRLAPRQCIAIGNKWTTGVCSLVKVYLENPLVVIGNQIEAAMFCKVRQIVNYVSSSKRESELLSLLDKYTLNNEHEIIIFSSTAKDAERVAQMLEYYSFTILLAHEFLWPEQLVEVRRQWNTPHSSASFLILVMTDGVIDKCNIRTATCVIHYDSAPTKKLFGKRMFCMAASYPSTKEKECLSLTIGTEYSRACARNIKELALRSSGVVPPTLEKVCEFAYQEKEEKRKNDDLCTNLKAFGQCKDLLQCKSRHTVFPDVDVSVLLPKSGIVKVLILAVLDASRYFVRILEHQSDNQEMNNTNYYSGATFLKLALDLNSLYTSRDNRHICSRIHLQKLCVVESEGSYYRAKIIQVVRRDPETNRALEVQVYFIDRGFYEVIPSYNLFEIAPQFVDVPYQAVEAYVCRIKPFDNDKNWTNKAVRYVVQHIEGQELEGRVIMGLRNTIWLDSLVAKEHLKEINVTTNTFNVRLDLLKEGLAVPNQEHVENLKKNFTSFVRLKDITGRENSERSSDSGQIETCTLREQVDEMVKISSILNPELFYVRLYVNINSLEDLVDQINEDIETQSTTSHEQFSVGSLCLAKSVTDDERWYRAKILSIRPEREYDVFFVDYGDREWITQDRIAPMRPEYLQFPFQAIECSLVNISPVGTEWTEDDAEGLWNLVEDKLLYAKAKSKSAAMLAGTCRYGIELCDTSTERDVLVNHELVIAGHAQATLEYHKTLFPEAFDSNTTGHPKEPYEEIPVLCLQLDKAQDPNTKLRYAQEIKNIVSENMKRKDDIRESGGVRCICRLLGVSKNEAVQEYIVITLAFLATQNDLNCEEIRREGGLKVLCDLLSKAKNVKVQEHAAWAIKILATSERNRDATREIGGIKNLCDLLASTDQEKVQENICWALVSLCSDSNNNCDAVREAGGLSTLFKLLETSRSNFVLENAMWAISLLSYNASNKMVIGQQGGIEKICNFIRTNQDEKILQNAVRSLKTLSSYNDDNREIMCRLGIIDLMRRLSNVETQLPFDTRRTCLDLIQRLLGRAPDVPLIEASSITSPLQEPIKCKPIAVTKKRKTQENGKMVNGGADSDDDLPLLEDTMDLGRPTVHPMTMWSQTKRIVSLSIRLRGVQEKITNITEKTFYFRTKHMEKLYELNLELFADVIPKESKVHLRGSEVLVNLKKAQPATWQRLLSTTGKPPFLSIDFDRWDTDSGSDEESEIKQPRVPTSRTSTKQENKILPRPFDDDHSDSSELSSGEEDTRERIGLDFS